MKRLILGLMLFAAPALAADDATLSPTATAAYLAASAATPGTFTRASGLQYRVLKPGFGRRPGGNDVVRIAYSIKLVNGTQVDATQPSLPAAMSMSNVVIAGLAEALNLMHVGDRWQLVIPASLGFGINPSANGAIPGNQTLVMDVTLVSTDTPRPGEAPPENPFSTWSNGREMGTSFTYRP